MTWNLFVPKLTRIYLLLIHQSKTISLRRNPLKREQKAPVLHQQRKAQWPMIRNNYRMKTLKILARNRRIRTSMDRLLKAAQTRRHTAVEILHLRVASLYCKLAQQSWELSCQPYPYRYYRKPQKKMKTMERNTRRGPSKSRFKTIRRSKKNHLPPLSILMKK